MKQAVAYYRVSTQRQGRSGLGLEAQQTAVLGYCKLNEYELIDEIVEVISTRKRQIALANAMEICKQTKSTLIVAKLDRLGRDVEEIAHLVKSEVEIIVTDNPHANRFTIHILAAVAEEQRQRIVCVRPNPYCTRKLTYKLPKRPVSGICSSYWEVTDSIILPNNWTAARISNIVVDYEKGT